MTAELSVVIAQQDFPVGDVDGNVRRVVKSIEQAEDQYQADLLVFPELTLSGYPPEDLLLRRGFLDSIAQALRLVVDSVGDIHVLLGHPLQENGALYNAVSWIHRGQIMGQYRKQALPNYAVFDEKRYFKAGEGPLIIEIKSNRIGVLICEDIWEAEPLAQLMGMDCDFHVVTNASPFHLEKRLQRSRVLAKRAQISGVPIVYANLVGGQDELVFDGSSFVMHPDQQLLGPAAHFRSGLFCLDFASARFKPRGWAPEYEQACDLSCIYQALVLGTRDYIQKNGFKQVVLGLSGGIDSALTLAVAVDALGAGQVRAVLMPSRHTSDLSNELAISQAQTLGVEYHSISIEPAFQALLNSLESDFTGTKADITEENLQARVRGNILMAFSNKFGEMLLTTGNKSEVAVGYSTIYGDMCGGFAPIKDCSKTLVYRLADYRNTVSDAIPQGVIDRPPSAELAPGQVDQDSLPAYEILDEIISRYVEKDESVDQIVAAGFDEATVRRIARLILVNEYKRRQSAPGVRVTPRAFGRDRRYPMTSAWRDKG